MKQGDKIFINTIAQYVRIIFVAFILLYSTRIVLKELGNNDFGLYSLVGSVLAFISFLNTTMSRTTQRFLSYSMGKDDVNHQKDILFNSVLLHIFISVITLVIIMSLEPVLFNGYLSIDVDKIDVAKKLYFLMAISVAFTINSTPYNAVFISHENIVFVSIIYVITAAFRLLAALSLQFVQSDKLVFYGLAMCGISAFEFLIYLFFSSIKYAECRSYFRIKLYKKEIIKSLLCFSGWNLYGTVCVLSRTQGYAIVLNKCVGLIANTSYGIATQISGQINNLVYSASNAVSPVIMKSEGANDRDKMIYFSIESSKISFLMFAIIAIPLIFEINYILKIWLGEIPDYTVPFITSIIIASFFDSLASGLRTGIQAIGDMKKFSLLVYSIKILSIPLAVFLLNYSNMPELALIPFIITEIVGTHYTIKLFCKFTQYSVNKYYLNVVKQILPPLLSSILVCTILIISIEKSLIRAIMTFVFSIISTTIVSFIYSFDSKEKEYAIKLYKKIFSK